tara:strand:+ start:209 stop:514 length:306 start_codon:yes stop_codon:yes gene_type:complete
MSDDPAIQALMGLRDDVYPCREDVPADLWGKPIVKRKSKMSNPQFDSLWNPWNTSYKNIKVNVTFNMKVKDNYVHPQRSEVTKRKNHNDESKKVLRNTRGE